jgi:hypothetical protein
MMNERIKELLLKAGWDRYEALDERNQKFAELIVRECVRVMYDNAIERKVPPDIDKTPLQYAIAIKEHFGVEE